MRLSNDNINAYVLVKMYLVLYRAGNSGGYILTTTFRSQSNTAARDVIYKMQ